MKLKFKIQNFQTDAVNAVADLFSGQRTMTGTFAVSPGLDIYLSQNGYGFSNPDLLSDEELLKNMHAVQIRNRIAPTDNVSDRQFSVEMETGTGKTYVYTKTIFELHKKYGFVKFIIVVPSVAIREGVYKSLRLTEEHFALTYDNAPCRYFIYNSARLSDVRQFAVSSDIEIMIINIDAFRKAENIINQEGDKLSGVSAIKYIRDTRPIVIIDEPQSVDGTAKAKEAIASLNPLVVLRYSATHKEIINPLYRLTPVDAYQMGLVKRICVSSNTVEGGYNKPYIRLVSVSSEGGFKARLELDVKSRNSARVTRKTITVKPGSDLFALSGGRELYDGYKVSGIDCTPEFESVEFGNAEVVRLDRAIGDVDENIIRRAQIRRTVEAHLNKELRYTAKGIKVLSLFFIDEVKKYRAEDGTPGIYAKMFEECYDELIKSARFSELADRFPASAGKMHDGYFSQDKKGGYKDTRGDTQDDYKTYDAIMKDKEWLLSFDCPLRFIFSHSALKEGWDNPNVFQVCTLIEQKSTFSRRQKIGRGLRLCVNQDGDRIEDENINILHVMANESFADFAEGLQKEIEEETGAKFGVLHEELFVGITYRDKTTKIRPMTPKEAATVLRILEKEKHILPDEARDLADKAEIAAEYERETEPVPEIPEELASAKRKAVEIIKRRGSLDKYALSSITCETVVVTEKTTGREDAADIMKHLIEKEYTTKKGAVRNTLKEALKNGTLDLPEKYEQARNNIEEIIRRTDPRPPLRNENKETPVLIRKEVFYSPEFTAIWDRIKQKTAYRVELESRKLVECCVKKLKEMPDVPPTRVVTRTADINIRDKGVDAEDKGIRTMDVNEFNALPDILLAIQDECGIPLPLCRDILVESGRLKDYITNPQQFIENSVEIIKKTLGELEIDGIKYIKLAGQKYYAQEIFSDEELQANLDINAVRVNKSVYDHVIYDSFTVERPFAVALDNDPDVKMFFKIPPRFKIKTPIGNYNPDWAVYMDKNGEEKLYLVFETKGSTNSQDLRGAENMKIHCGKRHFEALGNGMKFYVANNWDDARKTI